MLGGFKWIDLHVHVHRLQRAPISILALITPSISERMRQPSQSNRDGVPIHVHCSGLHVYDFSAVICCDQLHINSCSVHAHVSVAVIIHVLGLKRFQKFGYVSVPPSDT